MRMTYVRTLIQLANIQLCCHLVSANTTQVYDKIAVIHIYTRRPTTEIARLSNVKISAKPSLHLKD